LRAEMRKNGVDIATSAPVEKILVERGKVAGVRIADNPPAVNPPELDGKPFPRSPLLGKTIRARAVLSNGNLLGTIFDLVGEEKFDDAFIAEAKKVRLNNSSTQVYMAIKPEEALDADRCGDLLFTSVAPEFDAKLLLSKEITSRTYSFYYPKTRPGTDRHYIVASANARYEDWGFLSDADYRAAKEQLIETTLDSLEKYVPGIREKLAYVDAATPRTFKDYTAHWGGASFGTKYEGLAVSRSLHKNVAGLFHAGSVGIIMSGWLGAVNYGMIAANDAEAFLTQNREE
jgi:phytoene dehydrogenase-like protein